MQRTFMAFDRTGCWRREQVEQVAGAAGSRNATATRVGGNSHHGCHAASTLPPPARSPAPAPKSKMRKKRRVEARYHTSQSEKGQEREASTREGGDGGGEAGGPLRPDLGIWRMPAPSIGRCQPRMAGLGRRCWAPNLEGDDARCESLSCSLRRRWHQSEGAWMLECSVEGCLGAWWRRHRAMAWLEGARLEAEAEAGCWGERSRARVWGWDSTLYTMRNQW